MRLLFASTSGLGHVQPLVPLAQRALERGHDVTWGTGPDAIPRLSARGFEVVTAGASSAERMSEYRRRWPESSTLQGPELVAHMFPRLFGSVAAHAAFRAMGDAFDTARPDLVVHDAAEFASPIIAAARGLPHVTHGFGLVVPAERVELASARTEELWNEVGLPRRPFGGCYDHLYLDIYPPSLQRDALRHIPNRQLLRPASTDAAPGEVIPDATLRAIAASPRPVVYLTFGTVFNVNDSFAAAIAGLSSLDVIAVVTVGPNSDPQAFGPLPNHVAIERYIPQSLLLPYVRAVVSHAGSGTLLATLAAGLPQVCLPQAADQFRNADAVAGVGAALTLTGPPSANAEAIATATLAILENDRHRDAARTLAEEIASMPSLDDVVDVLVALAR